VEELLRELVEQVKGLRADIREAETRTAVISWICEPMLESALKRYVNGLRMIIQKVYDEAKERGNHSIVAALDHAPVRLLPDEHKNNETR